MALGAVVAWWLKPCKKSGACAESSSVLPVPVRAASPPLSATVYSSGGFGLQPANFSPPLRMSPVPAPAPAPVPVVIPPKPVLSYNYVPPPPVKPPAPAYNPVATYDPRINLQAYVPPVVSYNYQAPVVPNPRFADIWISPEAGGPSFRATYNPDSGQYDSGRDDPGAERGFAVRPYPVDGRPDGEILVVIKQAGQWGWY